jgi:hypothetical protein
MKNWKIKNFENSIKESHINIFKSLETKHFIEQFLKNYNLLLHDYKLNFSNSKAILFISVHNPSTLKPMKKKTKKIKK